LESGAPRRFPKIIFLVLGA